MDTLKGKTIVVLLATMHDEREFWYPVIRLREAGATVVIAGKEAGKKYEGKDGMKAESDKAYGDVDAGEVDGVVIPGGFGPDYMRRSKDCLDLVKKVHDQKKLVAFICHAGWVPASCGIVKGKKVTGFPSIKDDMVNAGAEWVDKSMVRDGNLISSRNPDDLPDFIKGVIAFFSEAK